VDKKAASESQRVPAMSRNVSHKARMPNLAARVQWLWSTLTWLHVLTTVCALDGNPEGTASVLLLVGTRFENEALQVEA